MKRPIAERVGGDVERQPFGGLHIDGVFLWFEIPGTVVQFHEHSVKMNGMIHHGVVDQGEAHSFAVVKLDGLFCLGVFLAVEAPHIAFHIACDVKFDFSTGRAGIFTRLEAAKVTVKKNACSCILQASAGFV